MTGDIKQEFIGVINGVEIKEQMVFRAIEYIVLTIEEDKQCVIDDRKFIERLDIIISNAFYDYEALSFGRLEWGTVDTITEEMNMVGFRVTDDSSPTSYDEEFAKECDSGLWDYILKEKENE